VQELGEIETPIVLTNTLNVAEGIAAIVEWTLARPGNEDVRSVNAVVGETNDGYLNDIRARILTRDHFIEAIEAADTGPVTEGAVGAGTGTVAFGFKGGIGTSSRRLPASLGGFVVGVLVQSNFGGVLSIDGVRVGEKLGQYYLKDAVIGDSSADGSIMIRQRIVKKPAGCRRTTLSACRGYRSGSGSRVAGRGMDEGWARSHQGRGP
jgi:D-aminopeptidase